MQDRAVEEPLSRGNVNLVVRLGETVRREQTPQSLTIHALLKHLEAKVFPSPRFLGVDEQDREVLSYIEGETGFPKDFWNDSKLLVTCAQLLRTLHVSLGDFVVPDNGRWAYEYPDTSRHEVINHNDFAPYNLIFGDEGSVSVIDFDLCGPGPRSRDLAYLAYWMAPLSFADGDLAERSEAELKLGCPRFSLLCDSYGFRDRGEVLKMVSEVLHHMSDDVAVTKMVGEKAAARLKADGHFEHWSKEAMAFDRVLPVLISKIA